MKELTTANYNEEIGSIPKALILCYKDECPHCMNIKKVINKYLSVTGDDLPIYLINSETEKDIMDKLDAELVPTTCFIKDGKMASSKRGLYNYKELKVLVQEAL